MATNYRIPKGARIVSDTFSSPDTQKLINKVVAKPSASNAGRNMWNPKDAYAPNGFLSNLGRRKQKLWGGESKDTDTNYKYPDLGQDDVESGAESSFNNHFSSIPRLAGLLGQYVTPASKVSMTELYQMSLDGAVSKILRIAKSLIISNTGEFSHSNPEFKNLVDESIENAGGIHFKMRALDYLMFGFSVGEKIWGVNKDYYNVISDVTFAPQNNIQFRINELGQMDAALQPNLTASQFGLFPAANLDAPESVFSPRQLIPTALPYIEVERDDLFYAAIDNMFDPFGVSPLRTAYKYFEMKNLALDMLMTALARNGVPTLAVYYQKDMIKDEEQRKEFENYIDQLAIGGTLYLPGRRGENFEVEPISLDSSGISVFIDFAKYCDEMMSSALSFPNSLVSDSGSSYSQSDIQKQTFEEAINLYVDVYKYALQRDIIKPLAKYNFPEIYKNRDWGTFTGKSIGLEDKGKLAKVYEMFANGGVINSRSLEDVNVFRQALDLPLFTSADDLPDPEALDPKSMRDTQGTYSNQEFDSST